MAQVDAHLLSATSIAASPRSMNHGATHLGSQAQPAAASASKQPWPPRLHAPSAPAPAGCYCCCLGAGWDPAAGRVEAGASKAWVMWCQECPCPARPLSDTQ